MNFRDRLKKQIQSKMSKGQDEVIYNIQRAPEPTDQLVLRNDDGTVTLSNGLPAEEIKTGNVHGPAECALRMTNDKWLVVNQQRTYIQQDVIAGGLLLLATWSVPPYETCTKLFIRRIDNETEYEVPLPDVPNDGMWGDTVLYSGWHDGPPCQSQVQPLLSPSGKHLFIPLDSRKDDPRCSIKFRVIKNFKLQKDENEKAIVVGEIIDKTFTFDWEFAQKLPCVGPASPPEVNLTSVTTQYSTETEATTNFEPVTDETINTIWGEDVLIYDLGWVAPISAFFPPVYNLSSLHEFWQDNWFYTFTEDVNKNPVVNFYCEYLTERFSCKNFQVSSYASSDPNYSGFYPFVNGYYLAYLTNIGNQNKVKLNLATQFQDNSEITDQIGQKIYRAGWGDSTPPTDGGTPPAPLPPEKLYIRNMTDKNVAYVWFEDYEGERDRVGNKGITITSEWNDPNWSYDTLTGAAILKVRHALKWTYPPYGEDMEDPANHNPIDPGGRTVPLSYIWFADESNQSLPQDWYKAQRLYLWLKNVSLLAPAEDFLTYLRINPDSMDFLDVPFVVEFQGIDEYKLVEIDLSRAVDRAGNPREISIVSSLALVYFDGNDENIRNVPEYQCWFDVTGVLVKDMFNPPNYAGPCWYYHEDPENPAEIYPYTHSPQIYKNITYGEATFSEGIRTYEVHNDGDSYANSAAWTFAGFLGGRSNPSTLYRNWYFSNSEGMAWSPYVTFINSRSKRGLLKILNLQSSSPEVSARLIDDEIDLKTAVGLETDEGNLQGAYAQYTPESHEWEFWNVLLGAWSSKGTNDSATSIYKYAPSSSNDHYYYSPYETESPANKGEYKYWEEPRGWTGPHFSDKLWGPDVSALEERIPDEGGLRYNFLRFKDSYVMMAASIDISDPEKPKGQIIKLVWDEETQKMKISKFVLGKTFTNTRLVDWHIF